MSKEKSQISRQGSAAPKKAKSDEVEVLYQKMGDRWFAFSLIDDEVFVGSISQEELDAIEASAPAGVLTHRISGNS